MTPFLLSLSLIYKFSFLIKVWIVYTQPTTHTHPHKMLSTMDRPPWCVFLSDHRDHHSFHHHLRPHLHRFSTFCDLLTRFSFGRFVRPCWTMSFLLHLLFLSSFAFCQPEHLSPRTVTTKYGALRGFLVKWTTKLPLPPHSPFMSSVASNLRSSSSSSSPSSYTSSSSTRNSSAAKFSANNPSSSAFHPVEIFLGVPYATGTSCNLINLIWNLNIYQPFCYPILGVCFLNKLFSNDLFICVHTHTLSSRPYEVVCSFGEKFWFIFRVCINFLFLLLLRADRHQHVSCNENAPITPNFFSCCLSLSLSLLALLAQFTLRRWRWRQHQMGACVSLTWGSSRPSFVVFGVKFFLILCFHLFWLFTSLCLAIDFNLHCRFCSRRFAIIHMITSCLGSFHTCTKDVQVLYFSFFFLSLMSSLFKFPSWQIAFDCPCVVNYIRPLYCFHPNTPRLQPFYCFLETFWWSLFSLATENYLLSFLRWLTCLFCLFTRLQLFSLIWFLSLFPLLVSL